MNDDARDDVDFEPAEELGSVAAAQAKLKKLKEELERVKTERQEYLDGWQRCKADSVNARKEALQAAERASSSGREQLLENIIPVVDSFDMAMGGETWSKVDATWRKGVESILNQLLGALQESGAAHFGVAGEPFDPQKHHALTELEGDGKPNTVARVIRRGWRVGERIIRPAEVALFIDKE